MNSLLIQATAQSQAIEITRIAFESTDAVTSHPVEAGVDVVDHIQRQPDSIVLDVIVTNTPLPLAAQGGVAAMEAFLESARGQLLSVVLGNEGVFENYALSTIARIRTVLDGRSYTLRLIQIRFALALNVRITPVQTPVAGAPDGQSAGQQATTEEDTPISVLRAGQLLFKAITGLGPG